MSAALMAVTGACAVLCRGGMVFTFMQARGQATGSSLVEAEKVELARSASVPAA